MFQKDEWSRSVHFCVKSIMLNNKSTPFKLQCCILSHFMFSSIREQEMCCYVPRECIGYKHAARHLSIRHQMILFPLYMVSHCWVICYVTSNLNHSITPNIKFMYLMKWLQNHKDFLTHPKTRYQIFVFH